MPSSSAHVTEEVLGHRPGAGHVLAGGPLGVVTGDLELQGQCSELMAEDIVQVPSDAQTLRGPAGALQQRTGGTQLGVRGGELGTRLDLTALTEHSDRRERLEGEVGHPGEGNVGGR